MIKIYGLTQEQINQLSQIALAKIHKKSISALAKKLLLELLTNCQSHPLRSETDNAKKRPVIRLNTALMHNLQAEASSEGMTLNKYIVLLLHNYSTKTKHQPTLEQRNILRQSNYQLVQIGKNLNQIAKALNQGQRASLNSQKLEDLRLLINEHTNKVADFISSTPTL